MGRLPKRNLAAHLKCVEIVGMSGRSTKTRIFSAGFLDAVAPLEKQAGRKTSHDEAAVCTISAREHWEAAEEPGHT